MHCATFIQSERDRSGDKSCTDSMCINGRMANDNPLLSCVITSHTRKEAVMVPSGWYVGLRLSQVAARMSLRSTERVVHSVYRLCGCLISTRLLVGPELLCSSMCGC